MGNKKKTAKTNTLQATVEKSGDKVSVLWEADSKSGKRWKEYDVLLDDLQHTSSAAVKVLRDLESCDWEDKSESAIRPLLGKLASAGMRQYEVLMSGDSSHQRSMDAAKEFRTWFEDEVAPNSEQWRIQIIHKQYEAPLVCWGLTFTPISQKELRKLTTDWKDYSNFWVNSFCLACRGLLAREADRLPELLPIHRSQIALTVEVSDDHVAEHRQTLKQEDQLEGGGKVANSVRLFEMISKQYEEYNLFWYVSLERADNAYVVDDDELTLSSIQKARDNTSQVFIMFLDGDSVIRSKRGTRWVNELLDKGRTGLISSEIDIKNEQLTHFGWEFLKYVIYTSKPLIDAVHEARKHFWPRSLLYGVYCDPLHIYFEPPPDADVRLADGFLESLRNLRQ